MALGHCDGRPFHLVFNPVLVGWLHNIWLIDDAGFDPRIVWFCGMQREDRGTAGAAKMPLYFSSAPAHILVTPHFGSRFQLQILTLNSDSDVEGASIRPSTIFTVAIVRRADRTRIPQPDSAAQT